MVKFLLKSSKLVVLAGSALVLGLTSASASTVNWGNATIGNGVGLLNGTLVPAGSLVRLGTFNLTAAQITANANNQTFLNANFIQFASTTIGAGNPFQDGSTPAGYWANSTTNLTTLLGDANQQLYYWVFNTPTFAAATQDGVFTTPGNAAWVLPADTAIPNTVTNDLGSVPNTAAGILIGKYGTGNANGFLEYNLAQIVVPEPSTYALALIGMLTLGFFVRRRQAA